MSLPKAGEKERTTSGRADGGNSTSLLVLLRKPPWDGLDILVKKYLKFL